jgi:hypothetical protein
MLHCASMVKYEGVGVILQFSGKPLPRPHRFLTNKGIDYLREYLNLPSEIVPATLKKSNRPLERGPPMRGDRPPRREVGQKVPLQDSVLVLRCQNVSLLLPSILWCPPCTYMLVDAWYSSGRFLGFLA